MPCDLQLVAVTTGFAEAQKARPRKARGEQDSPAADSRCPIRGRLPLFTATQACPCGGRRTRRPALKNRQIRARLTSLAAWL